MNYIAGKMSRSMATKPIPFHVYLWTMACLTVVGLTDAIYLGISHYRVYTDLDYKSFCAISRALNCDTVSQSPYSIILNLPLAVWGVIGYAFLLSFVIFAASKKAGNKRIWSLICWISLAFSGYSVVLAWISTFVIKSYCIMCIISYSINFALLFLPGSSATDFPIPVLSKAPGKIFFFCGRTA